MEEKIVDYKRTENRGWVKALVISDSDIGVTIVNADDHNHYLFCLRGPDLPWTEGLPLSALERLRSTWPEKYSIVQRHVETGVVVATELLRELSEVSEIAFSESAGPGTCPFR